MSDIITKDLAKSVEDQVIAWRRELHQCPELGMKTVETEKIILRVLKEIGIEEVRSGIGGQDCHGVAAVHPGRDRPAFCLKESRLHACLRP